ncbi:MAG TPA: PP2C family serine/threonine-protein phosphatase [Blastocatellia bacterium]|nr:PP2C family serine/threonine-protein phosphatase [Blastocatellia bacterium]
MWKYGFASVVGTSHAGSSSPVQDSSRAEVVIDSGDGEILIAAASDGAGSAAQAETGSRLACDLFVEEVKSHFAGNGTWPQLADGFIESWIGKFQNLVAGRADDEGLRVQDFACTLLAAVIGDECAAYFQIGDGAVVESRRDEKDHYRCVCWPQQGEYANTTNFLTDADAAGKAFQELKTDVVDEVALFTDGIQSLVLDYRAGAAHSPFFAPLFAWLRPRPGGYSQELSDALATYLNSEKVNSRTDDDKTLILASRRRH